VEGLARRGEEGKRGQKWGGEKKEGEAE